MRIFITGGTGFIGAELVRQLAKTKHTMVCLARTTSNCAGLNSAKAKIAYGDVSDRASLLAGMKGCDWAVNLANVYSLWEPDRRVFEKINVEGTRNVLECALKAGLSKVVHVSTSVIWGNAAEKPFTELTPPGTKRFNDYARSKYEGDLIAWELFEKRGLPLVMVYPGAVMGAGDPKVTGQFIAEIVGRTLPAIAFPGSVSTYVHVRDVAGAIIKALEKKNNIGEKYLVGKHRLASREIYDLVSKLAGVPLPKITMPDFLVSANAVLLTGIADLTKKPPLWGMSTGLIRQMKGGLQFDGSKTERELGIAYTPILQAIRDEIDSLRDSG